MSRSPSTGSSAGTWTSRRSSGGCWPARTPTSCWCRAWPGPGKSTLLAHLAWWWQRTGLVEEVFRVQLRGPGLDRQPDHPRDPRAACSAPVEQARADTMPPRRSWSRSPSCCARPVTCSSWTTPSPSPRPRPRSRTPSTPPSRPSSGPCCRGCAAAEDPGADRLPRSRGLAGAGHLRGQHLPAARPGPPGRLHPRRPHLAPPPRRTLAATTTPNGRPCRTWSDLLGGYPLPMTVVLPVLAATAPSQVLAELKVGGAGGGPGREDHPGHRVQPRQARPGPAGLAAAARPVHRRHPARPPPRALPGRSC